MAALPPFARAHARWPCDIEIELFAEDPKRRRVGRGLLIDISLSGAFLRCGEELTVGSSYLLLVAGEETEFPFRVAREGPKPKKDEPRHYGLTFALESEAEARLRQLIDKLPRESTLEDDLRERSTRGYWG